MKNVSTISIKTVGYTNVKNISGLKQIIFAYGILKGMIH